MSSRGPEGVSAAELYSSLQLLAARLTAQGHPLEAIKCYVAMLSQSLLPSDEAAARLRLGQLLLEHTLNVQDARLNLQKAEMLVMPLPGQHLLKCEVLAALAETHQSLGETDFQRRCYSKGLEVCRDPAAPAADRRCLAEWSIYLHLHMAESMVAKGQTEEAVQQVGAAAALAGSQGLLQQQVLCHLFHLQLAVMQFDRQAVSSITSSVTELIQQLVSQVEEQQQGQEQLMHLVQLKLHFLMLQFMFLVQSGNFKELQGGGAKEQQQQGGAAAAQAQSLTEQIEELLQQLQGGSEQQQQQAGASAAGSTAPGQPQPYEWLPHPLMAAAVYLLAAVVDKNGGKQKQGQARIGRGLQVLDAHLKMLLQDRAAAADAPVQSRRQQELRACLALRLMLLETRQQLHLLCSNFAAARVDAAESINVQQQFPKLLAGLEPMVHLQAGLYAQAVGAAAAAAGHFMAAAGQAQEQGELHLAADARHLAVVCYVADNTRESVSKAREVMGVATTEGDTSLGYGSRCLYHSAAGLLQLSGVNVGSDERADAKQHFSRALKMAHKHLHNHQVVSQLLMMMAPLQLVAADASGAKTMLSSCVQLSHGASDLHTQVSALNLMQQQLASGPNEEEAARNRNYVARKDEELSGRIQEAEANSQQHHMVLAWGLK